MKHFIFLTAIFLFQLSFGVSEFKFFSNFPIGEYRMNFKSIYSCDPNMDYKIKYNFNITQISKNVTEIKGNFTNQIPFDDNLTIEMNIAMKDPNTGWKENIMVQKVHGACSMFKKLMGRMWIPLLRGLGVNDKDTCPMPVGSYTSPGVDTSIFVKGDNVPKTFIYGSFKFRMTYFLKKEVVNCIIVYIDTKRP